MQYMPAVLLAKAKDYNFTTLEQLLADFERDVNEWSTP